MGWRTLIIAHPARLSLYQRQLVIRQKEKITLPLEDIAIIILEHPQIVLTHKLLDACAQNNVAVITTSCNFLPNGVFLPFQPHSRALKQLKRQLTLGKVRKKQIWQEIIQQKIYNQGHLLAIQSYSKAARQLKNLSRQVKPGDKTKTEAYSARLYFKTLFGQKFSRRNNQLTNAALNFGYSIIRSAIARQLVAYGFIPALGIIHQSELNRFNLADDLIEPYRPIIDQRVVQILPQQEEQAEKKQIKDYKTQLVSVLHSDYPKIQQGKLMGKTTLLSLIEASVISLGQAMEKRQPLTFPGLSGEEHEPAN